LEGFILSRRGVVAEEQTATGDKAERIITAVISLCGALREAGLEPPVALVLKGTQGQDLERVLAGHCQGAGLMPDRTRLGKPATIHGIEIRSERDA
jgi:hypothetical protein